MLAIELGIDGALSYESSDNVKTTSITLPVTKFRVGFFVSDAVSFEPSLALQYSRTTFESSVTGDEETFSGTAYDVDFGLLSFLHRSRTDPNVHTAVRRHSRVRR